MTEKVNHLAVDLPCRRKSLSRARSKVTRFALEHGFAAEAEDIALATQEALKNVIQHACPADNNMHLECLATRDTMVVEVRDQGPGFDVSAVGKTSSPLAVHGRGFQLMRGLMDEVSITSDHEGTTVRMEKKRDGSPGSGD